MQVWVGTSGYAYADWVGDFYPRGTSSTGMLAHYVTHFPLVELNFTFYRQPTALDLDRIAGRTPAAFQFLVKLHQAFSHEHDLSSAPGFREAVRGLKERGQLLGLLCQYPQRFHNTEENRQRLRALAELFAGHPLAIEFRHVSWHQPEIPAWLAELGDLGDHGLHLVSVDAPDLPGLYPSGLVQSSRLVYIRLHSRRGSSWYQSDKDRYDYLFSDAELTEWLEALRQAREQADRALVLFNNCRRAQAAANAQRLKELLEQLAPELEVVQPFAAPRAHQGRLFG
jgi:uncharacterized protein YecE (DUF72 family)